MPLTPETTRDAVKSRRGQQDAFAHKAYGIVITSTNSNSEEIKYQGPRGGSLTPVTHPYLGPNSWIRIMPEAGTSAIMGSRAENGEPYIQAYTRELDSATKGDPLPVVLATTKGKFFYRSLQEGEIDIMSRGIAGAFFARGGNLELRGGAVSMCFDAERLEIGSRAPTHQRAILGNKRQEVGDEERFGVVRRPNSLSALKPITNSTIQDIISVVPPTLAGLITGPQEFAKEYLRIIRTKSGDTLTDYREGVVVDDDGTLMTSDTTGNNLRTRYKVGTKLGEETLTEVDEEGNIVVTVPATASTGIKVKVGMGPLLGTDIEFSIAKDVLVSVGKSIVMDALQNIEFTGPEFSANTLLVNLVKGADTPAVRGQPLFDWLLSHTHPTAVGPSSPPVQAATLPTILSQFCKLK